MLGLEPQSVSMWLLYSVWKLLSCTCLNVFYCSKYIITFLYFLPWALNSFISVLIYKRECLASTFPAMEMNHHMIFITLSHPRPPSIYYFPLRVKKLWKLYSYMRFRQRPCQVQFKSKRINWQNINEQNKHQPIKHLVKTFVFGVVGMAKLCIISIISKFNICWLYM